MESRELSGPTERQQYWLEHIRSSRELKVSMASYARGHDLSVAAMRYWKKRLIELGILRGNEGSSPFAKVHMRSVPVDSVYCRIRFPNGAVVELGESLAGMPWRQLIATVGQLS